MKIEIIGIAFTCAILWMLMVSIINLLLLGLWKNRKPFVIKLPVKKKFKDGRLTPIYKICQHGYFNDYYIEKWELKWEIIDLTIFFMLIPFIYINFNKFGYHLNDKHIEIGNQDDVNDMNRSLEDFYEYKYNRYIENETKMNNIEKLFDTKLRELNVTFKQNYTK